MYIFINHQRNEADVVVPVVVPPVVAVEAVLVEVAHVQPIAVGVQVSAMCHPYHCYSTRCLIAVFYMELVFAHQHKARGG